MSAADLAAQAEKAHQSLLHDSVAIFRRQIAEACDFLRAHRVPMAGAVEWDSYKQSPVKRGGRVGSGWPLLRGLCLVDDELHYGGQRAAPPRGLRRRMPEGGPDRWMLWRPSPDPFMHASVRELMPWEEIAESGERLVLREIDLPDGGGTSFDAKAMLVESCARLIRGEL